MIVPSKLFKYEETITSKLKYILNVLKNEKLAVSDLYQKVEKNFFDINDFVIAMDALFVLGVIDILDGGIVKCLK